MLIHLNLERKFNKPKVNSKSSITEVSAICPAQFSVSHSYLSTTLVFPGLVNLSISKNQKFKIQSTVLELTCCMETGVSVAVDFVDRFASILFLQAFEIDPQNAPE